MALAEVLAVVGQLHVLHVVGYELVQCLVVGLGCEAERAVQHIEAVVHGCHEVDAALALDFVVERHDGLAVDGRRVAHLLEERCLVVESCGEAERHVLVEGRRDGQLSESCSLVV